MLTPVYWIFNKVQDQKETGRADLNGFESFHNIMKGTDIYHQSKKSNNGK